MDAGVSHTLKGTNLHLEAKLGFVNIEGYDEIVPSVGFGFHF